MFGCKSYIQFYNAEEDFNDSDYKYMVLSDLLAGHTSSDMVHVTRQSESAS